MRKPAAPLRFEPESDFVVKGHGNHRRRSVWRDYHVQAICQLGAFDSNLESFHALPPVAFALVIIFTELFSNSAKVPAVSCARTRAARRLSASYACAISIGDSRRACKRSEEHTSELQSLTNLVCRL